MSWLSDQRDYINGAMRLLTQNIMIGGTMAIIVLLLFLRSIASTLIVAFAIPISIIGSFIVMRALGTTLNIVSLAGIAFAVGMLVDNAIVVLENIDRHRRMGKVPFQAAYDGAREVWGAVLASSLTTIAVFLPVIFTEQEAGMLFRDIAVAVTCSVALSLFVSILVIPMVSRQLFENPCHPSYREALERPKPHFPHGSADERCIHGGHRIRPPQYRDSVGHDFYPYGRRAVYGLYALSQYGISPFRQQ